MNHEHPAAGAGALPRRPNRLAAEKSPYLRQHADNPVDWYPWGDAAFARARAEGKPVFLSIGYSTCHWCHVMERESFADETVAGFLNAHFVSIKVDREERPDVDKIYMTFVQATTGGGGWPLSVFLTPDRKPFYGGTYFPPDNRYGRPSFLQVLDQVRQVWEQRREQIAAMAEEIRARLQQATAARRAGEGMAGLDTLRRAARRFQEAYDPLHGGFGGAPKFPQPSVLAFLLRAARRFGDEPARRMVLHTCDRMAAGGIHDQLGGGFARYAVDVEWRVPHFEKMLYDNAQLAALYLDAFLVSSDTRWAAVARDTLDYLVRDLAHPEGGFYSAEDADSEGHEGKFYCWTEAELSHLLSPEEFEVVAAHFGITAAGNFVDHSHPNPLPGLNVLHVAQPVRSADETARLESAKTKMRAARARRVRPLRDEKILTSWNGLTLGALARAAAILGEEAYLTAAERNMRFLQTHLWQPPVGSGTGTLFHRWCDGQRDDVELLEDYAFLLAGVLHLYEVTLAPEHLEFALGLAEALVAKFFEAEQGGFWQSPACRTDLILRLKDDHDGAEPSGNSAAALGLLRLAALTDRPDLRQPAEATLRLYAERLNRFPEAMPYLLQALDFWLDEPVRVVIAGDPGAPATQTLARAAQRVYCPNKVVSGNRGPVAGIARSQPSTDPPRAHVCTGNTCHPPVDDPAKLVEWLR